MQANFSFFVHSQNNDDSCLAHALAALCYLVSEVGFPGDGKLSGSILPGLGAGNGPSFGVQEQLLLLLKCCLHRALELRLPHLVAFSRLVLAKFNLRVCPLHFEGIKVNVLRNVKEFRRPFKS